MSFSPASRGQYRQVRPRRPPMGGYSDQPKRFKSEDQASTSGFYQQQAPQQPGVGNSLDSRFNGPSVSTAVSDQENNVLLFTVMNAAYPITVDVMKAICSPYGQILRIMILRKNGVQALVEFDALTSARTAKEKLQGADIYSGCCTLKIDYAKSKRLNVIRNDADNFDCELTEQDGSQQQQQALLSASHEQTPGLLDHNPRMMRPPVSENRQQPTYMQQPGEQYCGSAGYYGDSSSGSSNYDQQGGQGFRPSVQRNDSYGMGHQGFGPTRVPRTGYGSRMDSPYGASTQRQMYPSPRPMYGSPSPGGYYGGPPMMGPPHMHGSMHHHGFPPGYNHQCVILANNLTCNKMNCDLLFNLLCVYGNVLRIKYLKSREGCAMVQMSQADPLHLYMRDINNTILFGSRLGISQSKQEYLEPVMKPFTLPDGQPSYKDFSESRANRYSDPKSASRNRPTAPSITLYYFNTPPDFSEEDVCKIFDLVGAKRPSRIKNFAAKKNPEDSRLKGVTGLAQWETISDATECLVLCNNHQIEHPSSKWPYIFKVTFSAANMPAGAITPEAADPSLVSAGEGPQPSASRTSGNYGEYNNDGREQYGATGQGYSTGGENQGGNNHGNRFHDGLQGNEAPHKGGN